VAARELCDATGALLIFDEVQTGMGRTGTLWAWEQTPVRPDVMTLAKGLGGGLPIGAIVTAPAYGDVLEPGDHGSTFAGGPVAASAALAAFGVLSDPELLERVRALGERLRSGLAELPGAVDVRGRGLMSAFDLAAGQGAPALVGRALAEQRLVLNATGPATVRLIPPLVVGEAEVDEALARLRALL
jgi:acetylornithine/succinyldiaminopimelate/putrescine aminotransferase